jgi:hypothetical protein
VVLVVMVAVEVVAAVAELRAVLEVRAASDIFVLPHGEIDGTIRCSQ